LRIIGIGYLVRKRPKKRLKRRMKGVRNMNEAEKEIHIKRYEENIKRIQSEIESLALYIDKKKTELKMWENAKNNK
jgi:hypothetical protein